SSGGSWLIRLDRLARGAQVIALPALPEIVAEGKESDGSDSSQSQGPMTGDMARQAIERRTGMAISTMIVGPDALIQRLAMRVQRADHGSQAPGVANAM